jgi:hypothetical protein
MEQLRGEVQAVGHHSPWEATPGNALSALHHIAPDKRFATAEDNEHFGRIGMGSNVVEHAEEVFSRHIGSRSHLTAVTATVATVDIAAHRALPKQLLQRMQPSFIVSQSSGQFQCYISSQSHQHAAKIRFLPDKQPFNFILFFKVVDFSFDNKQKGIVEMTMPFLFSP